MDGFISVTELQLFCEEHKGMIGQSALDGQLVLNIGDSGRGDAIYENLLDHLTVYGIDDLQRGTGADNKDGLYSEKDVIEIAGITGETLLSVDEIAGITGATLLSVEEAEELDIDILKASGCWWLRSPGTYGDLAAFVDGVDGDVYDFGRDVLGSFGVRPALIISDLESSNLQMGDNFIFGDHSFTIISDCYALCNDFVGRCAFRKDWKAEDANIYEKSDIKKYVDEWFAKAKEKENKTQEESEEELDKE